MKPNQSIRSTIIAIICTVVLACGTAAAAAPARHIAVAGPGQGVVHLTLEETWRAGGPEDDVVFGMVTRVVEAEDGSLYVMDGQLSQVHVYDRDGGRLRTLFSEGDGPGEVRGPRDVLLCEDGRVGVVQEMPGKLVFVDRGGAPAGELTIGGPGVSHGGMCQTFSGWAGGELLLVAGFVQSFGGQQGHMMQTCFLGGFDPSGRQVASFCADDHDIDFADFTFRENTHLAPYWWNADIGPDGRVYAVPRLDRYEIHVFAPDGTLERVIGRECEPWRRTADQKQAFVEAVKAIYGNAPIKVVVEASDFEPMIATTQRGVRVHRDGTVWVLPSTGIFGQDKGVMATFDVFSPEGEFLRQVAVHADADARHDGVFLLEGDRAVLVRGFVDAGLAQFTGGRMGVDLEGDEQATMEVVGCRVKR